MRSRSALQKSHTLFSPATRPFVIQASRNTRLFFFALLLESSLARSLAEVSEINNLPGSLHGSL